MNAKIFIGLFVTSAMLTAAGVLAVNALKMNQQIKKSTDKFVDTQLKNGNL